MDLQWNANWTWKEIGLGWLRADFDCFAIKFQLKVKEIGLGWFRVDFGWFAIKFWLNIKGHRLGLVQSRFWLIFQFNSNWKFKEIGLGPIPTYAHRQANASCLIPFPSSTLPRSLPSSLSPSLSPCVLYLPLLPPLFLLLLSLPLSLSCFPSSSLLAPSRSFSRHSQASENLKTFKNRWKSIKNIKKYNKSMNKI